MKPAIPARSVVRPLHRLQHGFSLIELMIALVMGMLIMAAVLAVYLNISSANNELAKVNSQIESGRFAMQLLENDVVHAGFWGTYVPQFDDLTQPSTPVVAPLPTPPGPGDVPTAIPDPCSYSNNSAYQKNLIGIPVQAYDSAAVCGGVITNKRANTDVLVVRHADTCTQVWDTGSSTWIPKKWDAATSSLVTNPNCPSDASGTVYFQSSLCETEIAAPNPYVLATSGSPPDIATFNLHNRSCAAADRADKSEFVSNIYYIKDVPDPNDPTKVIPTLMRSSFAGTAQQPAQPLIEGIEGFRVEFGIDSVSKTGAPVDYTVAINWTDPNNLTTPTNRGDGIPEGAFVHCTTAGAPPCTVANLTNAVAVKLYVLARAKDFSPGYTDAKTYCVGTPNADGSCPAANQLGPFNDNYKRHVFSTTIRLTDVAGRRETPP